MHPKNLRFRLSLLQFLQFFIWGSWFVTTGTYLSLNLNFDGREIGMVYSATAIAATISPFVIGIIADRFFSVEKLLAILHFVGAILLFMAARAESFLGFYIIILGYVMCYLPTFSLSHSLCLHHIDDAKKEFPRIRVWGTISWIIAGITVGWFQVEETNIPLYIASAVSIIHCIYCLTLPKTPPKQDKSKSLWQNLTSPQILDLFKDKSFVVVVVSIGLICIPTSYYYSFVNLFLNEFGVQNAAGKMAVGQITEIILMLILPLLFAKFRLKYILFIGLLMWGIRYGFFILGIEQQIEAWLIIGLLLHGAAYTLATFSAQIYIDQRVSPALRSTAQGFYSLLTMGIMALLGTTIAGETVLRFSENGQHDWVKIWTFPTIIGVVVAVYFFFFFKSTEKG